MPTSSHSDGMPPPGDRRADRSTLPRWHQEPDQPAAPEGNPLRLRFPQDGQTLVNDALRGAIVFDNARIKDPILVRSNGTPLYHLASMTDDHNMSITHVVRGEDLADNTPRQILLQRALGVPTPHHRHTPLVLAPDGEKLRKQHGAQPLDLSHPLDALGQAASHLGLAPAQTDVATALAGWVRAWSAAAPAHPATRPGQA